MAVPTTIDNLNVVASSNSPSGSDSVTTSTGPDEYFRALSGIIRRGQASSTLASAGSLNLGGVVTGDYINITGTTSITSFGTIAAGREVTLLFSGALILTHNATSLILPTGQNIQTVAGDVFTFRSEGSGNWRCTARSASTPLTGHVTTSPSGAAVLGAFSSSQLSGALSDESGSGLVVFNDSPVLVTPNIGVPSAGTLTNCTFPTLNQSTSGNAATVTTNANLTGHITSVGNAAVLGSFSSSELSTALTDETGTGAAVFGTTPTLVGLTATGDITMTAKSVNESVHSEAAHATTSDIWAGGNTCLLTGGAVTFTDILNAPQAGAVRYVVANAAHIFTDGATFEVDGNTNYTCGVGDILRIEAKTVSTFRVSVISHGDGDGIGVGQTWTDVTASRVAGTTYTNSTGRPIQVLFTCITGTANVSGTIAGISVLIGIGAGTSYNASTFSVVVPNGITYSVSSFGAGSQKWLELR